MSFEFPLVFFTVLTQLSVGVALMTAWKGSASALPQGACSDKCAWSLVFITSALGLVASLFHLGDPFRAGTALVGLGHSWLSREGLVFGAFTFFALVNIFIISKPIQFLTAIIGIAGIIMQGFTYAPVSMPAISNGVPMLFFVLSALSLGTAFTAYNDERIITRIRHIVLVAFLIVLLILPCVWVSGNALTKATAMAWLGSIPFWAGLLLMLVSLVMSFKGKRCLGMKVLLLVGILLTRMTFFADTLHTATRIGMPF